MGTHDQTVQHGSDYITAAQQPEPFLGIKPTNLSSPKSA